MTTHVKVLGILYIALSAMMLCGALVLALLFGTASGIVAANAGGDPDAALALPIIGIAGSALVIFLVGIALPGIIAGIGLLKYRPWARILGLVLAAINLINIPFGTILGAYGLWVLLHKETEQLFSGAPAAITTL